MARLTAGWQGLRSTSHAVRRNRQEDRSDLVVGAQAVDQFLQCGPFAGSRRGPAAPVKPALGVGDRAHREKSLPDHRLPG